MSKLNAVADWVVALNPFALAAFTCLVIAGLFCMALGAALLYFAAMSGAGEDCPADDEELPPEAFGLSAHQPETDCVRSACAWCHPGSARGICPAHSEQLKRGGSL